MVGSLEPQDEETYRRRHSPVQPIELIDPSDTYLLGYIVAAEIKARLAADPTDVRAAALDSRRKEILERGRRNQSAYLVSDHLDVYVATSMRGATNMSLSVNSVAVSSNTLPWYPST